MPERAAIVTGASSGIGLAIAHMLGREGYGLTVNSRRPEKLEGAVAELREQGHEVEAVAGSVADEAGGQADRRRSPGAVRAPGRARQQRGRRRRRADRDADHEEARRAAGRQLPPHPALLPRGAAHAARRGAEHKNALVVNTSSISGKRGEGWLSVYSATKHAVVGFTEAMNSELGKEYIKSCALCPAFVDTPMTDFVKGAVPIEKMITTEDVATMVRALLHLSPGCTIPEILFEQTGFVIGESL